MDRLSVESDRLHLLSEEHNLLPSAFTSQAPSVISRTSSRSTLKGTDAAIAPATVTTSAASLPPTASAPQLPLSRAATAARRFTNSEEEYLAALRAWVEEKQYVSLGPNTTLEGFYGKKTMDMYAAQPGPNWGRRGGPSGSKKPGKPQITAADLDVNGRRKTLSGPLPQPQPPLEAAGGPGDDERIPAQRRKSIRNWLAKR